MIARVLCLYRQKYVPDKTTIQVLQNTQTVQSGIGRSMSLTQTKDYIIKVKSHIQGPKGMIAP
jgi:hypothetical protein